MGDTVRNMTVRDDTVDNEYTHRLAHLFSLSIIVSLLFTSFPFVPLSVKVRISRHVRIHTISIPHLTYVIPVQSEIAMFIHPGGSGTIAFGTIFFRFHDLVFFFIEKKLHRFLSPIFFNLLEHFEACPIFSKFLQSSPIYFLL